MFRVFLSLGDRPDRSLKGIEMNGQTVVDPVASTSGAMTAADTTDWWAPVTQFVQWGWGQLHATLSGADTGDAAGALTSASSTITDPAPADSASSRVLDLGILDSDSEVRSRNFEGTILVEVVSQDEHVLARYDPDSASLDTVRVAFDCGGDPLDLPSSQFNDGLVTYIRADFLDPSSASCALLAIGQPVPPDSPVLPAHASNAVI